MCACLCMCLRVCVHPCVRVCVCVMEYLNVCFILFLLCTPLFDFMSHPFAVLASASSSSGRFPGFSAQTLTPPLSAGSVLSFLFPSFSLFWSICTHFLVFPFTVFGNRQWKISRVLFSYILWLLVETHPVEWLGEFAFHPFVLSQGSHRRLR